jgi:hypothetical protein
MTPELEKDMIIGIVAVFFTALFTGIPALLLFWWTWQRDQERLIVQKLLVQWQTASGDSVLERDTRGPTFGILIRNRSLFPVHVSAVGYKIDGNVIALEHPIPPSKMKQNPDPHSNRPYILDDTFDPWEIPSQASMRVDLSDADRVKIVTALLTAGEKLNLSIEDLLRGAKVEALVASETGKEFTSMSFRARVKHMFEKVLLPPETMA